MASHTRFLSAVPSGLTLLPSQYDEDGRDNGYNGILFRALPIERLCMLFEPFLLDDQIHLKRIKTGNTKN